MKGRQRIAKNRSKGALALAHSGASTDQIARTVGATDASVNYWISGEKTPGGPFRKKLKREYGIALPWWDEPIDAADPLAGVRSLAPKDRFHILTGAAIPADGEKVEPPTTAKDVRDLAGQYLDQVRMFMSTVQTDKLLTMTEKARTLRECSAALDKAGRLTGASAEIPVSKILKSPAWAKLGKIIADTIASHEDPKVAASIMRKLGEALKVAE